VLDSKVTSYSSEYWTDILKVNSGTAFNLSFYSNDYYDLGDPFLVAVKPEDLYRGANNTFQLKTGNNPVNNTGCSKNNTFIYSGALKATISYTDVLAETEGCTWEVDFEDGQNGTLSVPPDYSGDKICRYTSYNYTDGYNKLDSYDISVYKLFDQLDFDDDGRIFININENDLEVQILSIPQVPYMWGPAILEVRTWK
jgi:hypothetical protein